MIKSRCNSPGFRVAQANKMNDSNVDISFIEYKKSFINATDLDGRNSSENKNSRRWKMPDSDRPPRNQSYGDVGKLNQTACKTNYSVNPSEFNITAYSLRLGKNYAMRVTKNQNNTYTVTICSGKQYKPRRRRTNNDTYTEKEDMENATRSRWERSKTDYVKTKVDVDYMDTDGMESWSDTKSATGSTSKTE
jgi:hypothetical protein